MRPEQDCLDRSMFNEQRWELLARECDDLPEGHLLEIGSHRCGVAMYLARRYPERTVIAFDRFERGLSAPGLRDCLPPESYHEGAQGSSFVDALGFASGTPNLRLVCGDVCETLAQESAYPIALAVIDLNLYEPNRIALAWAWQRTAPGGVLLIDDLGFPGIDRSLAESGLPWEPCGYMARIRR